MKPEKIPDIIAPAEWAPQTKATGGERANGGSPPGPPAKKRRSFLASLLRIVFLLLVVLALLPVAAEIALRHVPFETWKPVAEQELSRTLKMPVTLNDAHISLLSGARIQGVTVGGETPWVRVREMVLDYDLFELMEGRLTVNQVLVDRPELDLVEKDGRWNFQPLLDRDKAASPVPEPAAKPFGGLPPIPLAVSVKDLSVKNLHLHFEREGRDRGSVDGLSLAARGTLEKEAIDLALAIEMSRPPGQGAKHNLEYVSSQSPGTRVKTLALADLSFTTGDLNRIGLSGRFSLSNSQLKLGDALPAPDLSSDFDIGLALKEQALDINWMYLEIDRTHRIKLNAAVREYLTHPHLDLTLAEAAFDIEKALRLAEPWLPPTQARGTLTLTGIHVAGDFPDFKPGTLVVDSGRMDAAKLQAKHGPAEVRGMNARVNLKNLKLIEGLPKDLQAVAGIQADYARLHLAGGAPGPAEARGVDARVTVDRLTLKRGVPENLSATAHLQVADAKAGEFSLAGLSQSVDIEAANPRLTDVKLAFNTALKSFATAHPKLAGLNLPINMEGSLTGNWAEGDFPSVEIGYSAGGAVQGAVSASAKKLGREGFQLQKNTRLDLAAVQGLIPSAWLERLKGLSLGGHAALTTEIEGTLDPQLKPKRLAATTRVDVEGLDAALTEPALDLRQLTAQLSFPAKYDQALGAQLGSLRLQADFDGLEALGNWRITGGHAEAEVAAGKQYIALPPAADIPLTHRLVARVQRVHSAEPSLELSALGLDAKLQAQVTPMNEIKNVNVDGTLSLDDGRAIEKITTGGLASTFHLFAADRSLTTTRASVTLDLKAPGYRDGEWRLEPGPTRFAGTTKQNLKTGDIDIEKAKLSIGSLLDWEASGQANQWGKEFDLKTRTSNLMLARLLPLLPPELAGQLSGLRIDGEARLNLDAKGRRPGGFDRKRPKIPLNVHALLELENGLVEWPGKNLHIKSANVSTRLDTEGQAATLSGHAGLQVTTPALQDTWLDPHLDFSYTLDDADKLTVTSERLSVDRIGLSHTLSGRIDGLRAFITGEAPAQAQNLLRRLDIALKTQNRLQIAEALKGPVRLGEGVEADGTINSELELRLKAADFIELDGQVAFDRFHARTPGGLRLDRVNGSFPFNKKLLIEKRLPPQRETFLAARKGFFSQLRNFSSRKDILQADAIEWSGHEASGLKMDLVLKNNQLMAERFIFDILGGALAGNFFLTQTPEGPMLNFFSEFARLDFDRLIPARAAAGKPGAGKDAEIDGSLKLGFQLRTRKSGVMSLDQITSEVAITRIGAETLDRLLLFIDPEESKPAIVDTRAKLELASPHKILLTLENGNLNVEAWLKNKVLGDIIKAPALRRVPVTGLKQFKALSDQIQSLSGLRDSLGALAARTVEFDANQKIVLY